MPKRVIPYRRFLILDLIVCLLAALVGALAFSLSFDSDIGYFRAGVFPTLLYCTLAAGVVIAISYAYLSRRERQEDAEADGSLTGHKPAEDSLAVRITAVVCAGTFAVAGLVSVWQLMSDTVPQTGALSKPATAWVALLTAFSALASAIYFAAIGLRRNTLPLFSRMGLGIPGYAVLTIIRAYFDMSVAMNAPTKVLAQFSLLAIALCHIAELWYLYGARPAKRLRTLGLLTLPLSFGYVLPMLAAIPAHGTALLDASSWVALMPQLAYTAYLIARLCSLGDGADAPAFDDFQTTTPADSGDRSGDSERSDDSDESETSDGSGHTDNSSHPDVSDHSDKEATPRG